MLCLALIFYDEFMTMQENYLSSARFADLPLHPLVLQALNEQKDLIFVPQFRRYPCR